MLVVFVRIIIMIYLLYMSNNFTILNIYLNKVKMDTNIMINFYYQLSIISNLFGI